MYDPIHQSDFHSILRIMATRRSIRHYRQEAIARELVKELLGCAINAPSAHNRQPWRFFIIDVPEEKVRLAEAMGSRLCADRLGDGDSPDAIEKDVAHSFERISSAPVVILVATTMVDMDIYRDDRRRDAD
jgi:coenzyme F420-0:L-glutamate ligase/coenzyme F420-1:gamma-L-glutamate ligase